MAGHDSVRLKLRRLKPRYARQLLPFDLAAARRQETAQRQRICGLVRDGLVRLGHDPEQCTMLLEVERLVADSLAEPPKPRAPAVADRATRGERKFAAQVAKFRDPSAPPPDLGKEPLIIVLAYVLARSPPLGAAPVGNRDSDAGG